MLDNHEAIKLTGKEREKEIASRLEDYLSDELYFLFREANCYDGSFDFICAFDAENIGDFVGRMSPYDIMCRIVFGNVNRVDDMLRFNAYGNLESVSKQELQDKCEDSIDEMADWLMDNYYHVDGLYKEDEELFDAWDDIDHGRYDWDEDEEE